MKIGDRVGIKWLAYSCLQCEFVRFFFFTPKLLLLLTRPTPILNSVVRV